MAQVTVTNGRYTTDSLYQWDLNQVLEIRGLSLPAVPEIHFVNDSMDRAIVRQASMDAAGVVTVYVPNALLQKPYKIKAYVCLYSGDSFKSEYLIEIPVIARTKPNDYTFEDDAGEIYSFNALENYVNDTVSKLVSDWSAYTADCEQSVKDCEQAVQNCNTAIAEAVENFETKTDEVAKEIERSFGQTLDLHMENTNNPHGVTAVQIGALPAIESEESPGCYYVNNGDVVEWINPPMETGTEYRTIERYHGLPVYIKQVSTKYCFDASSPSFQQAITSGISEIVEINGALRNDNTRDRQLLPCFATDGTLKIVSGLTYVESSDQHRIWVRALNDCQGEYENYYAHFVVKYTKLSDAEG